MDPLPAFLINLVLAFYYVFENLYRLVFPRESKDISKDVVLITGGANGLGQAMAFRFAEKGARIVLWDIDSEALDDTTKHLNALGAFVFSYRVDVTNKAAVYRAALKVKEEVGPVSILVNNAGVVVGKTFLELKDEEIEKTFAVNSVAHFWTTKAFLPDMIEQRQGHIVTIASLAGHLAAARLVDYCASKHAAVGFTDALRFELHNSGLEDIHVTEVSPYYIDTPMFRGVEPSFPTLAVDDVARRATQAVLQNEDRIYIPFFFSLVVALKNMLPFKTMFSLYKAMGECESMARFIGRVSSGTSNESNNGQTSQESKPVTNDTNEGAKPDIAEPSTSSSSVDSERPPAQINSEQSSETQVEEAVEPKPTNEPAKPNSVEKRGILSNFDDSHQS